MDLSNVKWADDYVAVESDDHVDALAAEFLAAEFSNADIPTAETPTAETPTPEIPPQGRTQAALAQGEQVRYFMRPKFTVNVYNASGSGAEKPRASGQGTGGDSVATGNSSAAAVDRRSIVSSEDQISDLRSQVQDLTKQVQRLSVRALEPRTIIQSGTWNTCDVRSYKNPQPHTEGQVDFPKRFNTVPTVSVGIYSADVSNMSNFRLRAYPTAIDTKGFKMNADSWTDTKLFSCGISWIAVGN
ncbi:hypothetical protein F5Y14DRAFT_461906 [Nemania sp. NC0429]|nr:hypothetical protein F5Y14DRAFT_461906 [Nemania sp. NC0429]